MFKIGDIITLKDGLGTPKNSSFVTFKTKYVIVNYVMFKGKKRFTVNNLKLNEKFIFNEEDIVLLEAQKTWENFKEYFKCHS